MRSPRPPTASAIDPGDAVIGAVGTLLFVLGFALLSRPPSPAAPASDVIGYLSGHRSRIFASACVIGGASALVSWFAGALRRYLAGDERDSGAATSSVLMLLGGVALVVAGSAVLAGVVLHVGDLRPAEVVLAFDVYNALITIAGFWFGGSVAAAVAAGARSGSLPARYRRTGLAVAAAQVATIPGLFAQSGAFAAGGAIALVAFWLLSAWFIAVAVHLVRHPDWRSLR